MIVRCCLAVLSILSGTLWGAEPADPPAPPETSDVEGYEIRRIEGWRVSVSADFLRDAPGLAAETLEVLEHQLFQIRRKVPAAAVEKLRQVTVWVEEKEPHHPCMAYHPSAGWLREHGMEPRKAQCIEIANARNFLSWTRDQPWMVLHELAHAYHDRFLAGGYGNPEIAAAYRRAMDAKRYDAVLHTSGRTQRAYAANNPMEYFAEASEAFFGANDFYPFVRAELRAHDPELYALLEKVWGRRR